jgi:uncharacterized membrane protein
LSSTKPTSSAEALTPAVRQVERAGAETPSSPPARRVWLAATGALVIAYAALSYYSASSSHAKTLGAALSIGPVTSMGLLLLWRWTKPLTAVLAATLVCAALVWYWPTIENNYDWADLAQQCGLYGLVAFGFARSLFGGRVPLCTQLAMKMHGALTPIEIDYTRRATAAWAMFYALIAAAILMLFIAAPLRVWSLFVNFATFALIILMGIIDHAVRRRLLPRHPAGGILAIIRSSITG